jgi:signal transduction histidine kinase
VRPKTERRPLVERRPVTTFNSVTLADLVAEQHDLLIERFIVEAKRGARMTGLERVELVDSMGFFLDDLVEVLAGAKEIAPEDSAAGSHGVERLAIGFRIDRVIQEYWLVAQLILDLADQHAYVPTIWELQALLAAVNDGAAISAAEYVRRREADLLQRESEHAAFLAHEVRNSLSSARFAFGLLQRRQFAPEDKPLVELVEGGLRQAGRRIDDTLTGARMRGGIVTFVRIYPTLMLEEIAAEQRPQAEARGVKLTVEGDTSLRAQGDARLMRSAVENLANNAIKFSCDGGAVIMRATARGERLCIEVEDQCGGIDEDTLDRLFRPFVQLSEERSGFGLGLAIARECAEAQNGSLNVRNLPGRGCVFTLTIPMHP